jgi:hypothetical protein
LACSGTFVERVPKQDHLGWRTGSSLRGGTGTVALDAEDKDEDKEWWDALQVYRDAEWGYVHLQRTKPQTPAFALTDSPVGLAAWILEKWRRWIPALENPEAVISEIRSFARTLR